jgi:phosphatidylserine synthase
MDHTPESPAADGGHADHGTPSVGPNTTRLIIRILIAVCVVVSLADFAYTKHGHFAFEQLPAFNSLYGFASYVFLVLTATQLRRILMRNEAYYD